MLHYSFLPLRLPHQSHQRQGPTTILQRSAGLVKGPEIACDPKHVGNLNLTFEVGPWQYYYGVDYIGPVSNESHYGGHTATYWGQTVNVVLKASAVTYHAASVTREFKASGLKATLGVANIYDKKPPRVTTLNLGELNTEGNSAFYSQYDWLGRRFFINLDKKF